MSRSDGARRWARVLSELAAVRVTVEWERPAWRVRWVDGPTREVLIDRAQALEPYRVGAPLPVAELRFARSSSPAAVALAWLAHGSPADADAEVQVEQACEDTGYPQVRADAAALAAADLLRRLAHGDSAEMGSLLAKAHPLVPPRPPMREVPDLAGRVSSTSWPLEGPPAELLGPSGERSTPTPTRAAPEHPAAGPAVPGLCARCAAPLPTGGRGRPAKYCSGACRTAAHRATHREETLRARRRRHHPGDPPASRNEKRATVTRLNREPLVRRLLV